MPSAETFLHLPSLVCFVDLTKMNLCFQQSPSETFLTAHCWGKSYMDRVNTQRKTELKESQVEKCPAKQEISFKRVTFKCSANYNLKEIKTF